MIRVTKVRCNSFVNMKNLVWSMNVTLVIQLASILKNIRWLNMKGLGTLNMFDLNYLKYVFFSKSVSLFEHFIFLILLVTLFTITNPMVLVPILLGIVVLFHVGKVSYTDEEDVMMNDVANLVQNINLENQSEVVVDLVDRLKQRVLPDEE